MNNSSVIVFASSYLLHYEQERRGDNFAPLIFKVMKKLFYYLMVVAVLVVTGCKKNKDGNGRVNCSLPSTPVPSEMVGNWANGYNSSTQLVDTYNGQYLGNAWQSGKFFHFSEDGKYAEFYYMANAGLSSSTATRVIGTVTFDEIRDGVFAYSTLLKLLGVPPGSKSL